MILKIHLETGRWRVRMTLDILFMQNNKPVVCINMTCSSLYSKIFDNLTNEEFSQYLWDFDASEDKTVTDKTFIKKVWDASIMYGYISNDYDILGSFVDMVRIIV